MEKEASSNKKTARIAGALFITATAASILSTPFLSPINASNYLTALSGNQNQVLIGVLFALIGAVASASIAISLYPVIKKYSQSLALGAVGFRLIEGMLYIVGIIAVVLLLTLSQQFVNAGAANLPYFQALGAVLLSGYHWASFVGAPTSFLHRRPDVLHHILQNQTCSKMALNLGTSGRSLDHSIKHVGYVQHNWCFLNSSDCS